MSVLPNGVSENYKGLGSSDQIESDGRISGESQRFFDVLFDENDDAPNRSFIAKADPGVPQLGDAHPYDSWIYVVGRNATVDSESPFLYHVTVTYKEIRNPLEEPPIIEWLDAASNEVIPTDVEGKAIANSAGEPVDPPHTEDIDDLVLRAIYNVSVFNSVGAMGYKGAVNSDTFFGFAPGTVKVMAYNGREINAITGNKYVEVTLELQFRADGWKRKFVDEGYRTKDGVDDDGKTKYKTITVDGTDTGDPVSEPVKLDGAGNKLDDGLAPVLIEYWTKPQLAFTSEFGFLGIA